MRLIFLVLLAAWLQFSLAALPSHSVHPSISRSVHDKPHKGGSGKHDTVIITAENVNNNNKVKTQTLSSVLLSNWFYIAEVVVLIIAKLNPQLGKTSGVLKPEFWINKVGVVFIFFVNGLSLSVTQLRDAGANWRTHALVQLYNLGLMPLAAYFTVSSLFSLPSVHALLGVDTAAIKTGLLCLFSLPVTINICVTLTQAAGADVVCAIFNAVLGNIIGVIWTPIVVFLMMGTNQSVSLIDTLLKLAKLVLLPIAFGQATRYTPIGARLLRLKPYTKLVSEIVLLGVVLNTFSDTFLKGFSLSNISLVVLTTALSVIYLTSNLVFWKLMAMVNPSVNMATRAAATICASQKTLAFGIPFIKTTFGGHPNVAAVLTPLLIWYPIQVFAGSFVVVQQCMRQIETQQLATTHETSTTSGSALGVLGVRGGRNTRVLRVGDIGRGSCKVDKNVSHIRRKLLFGKVRASLSVLCGFCILIDFFEELIEDTPYLKHLRRNLKLGHGMLLLTLSHMLHTIFELMEQLENHHEIHEERHKFKEALAFFQGSYELEDDAARAYDNAALAVFGATAVTNFSDLGVTTRRSKYRGVTWNQAESCWKVDSSLFLH